jgi:hypothetical protein
LDQHGRNFTWSNERDNPTFVRLDRFLITPACTTRFPNSLQLSLPNPNSDHCPLLCQCSTYYVIPNIFCFENYRLKIKNFKDLVTTQWNNDQTSRNPQQLAQKIKLLRQHIILWRNNTIGDFQIQLMVCSATVAWLDKTLELRRLTHMETLLRTLLKDRFQEILWQ